VDFRKGDPENPPTQEELEDKFRDLSAAVLSRQEIEATVEAVSHLEQFDDVARLLQR
ncbi:MAG: MmgE/PrpD family protein, partial [Actinomycetota bacterium]|nr:MmgE/PrpD family protein [Actinomycetota bacterium]